MTAPADLASMQRAIAELVTGAAAVASDLRSAAVAEELAAGNDRLSPAEQLDVYREQYLLRHLDVLREDFLTLEHALGDTRFETLAKAYLKALPSRSFSLRDLGVDLPRFVAETAPWSEDPLLADLARLEWAFVDAFDAPDAPPLDLATVTAVPEDAWPSARLVLQPSVQRLALRYPAHEARLAARSGERSAAEAMKRPPPTPTYVVLFRGAERLQCLAIDPDAYALLDELARGTALGDACERVATASGASGASFEEKVGAWFQQWTALGWLSRVDLA
ncbi:MAG: hypothetical protein QOI41_3118 [Myxococcales bacterium]|nr:hypothetical protein [Myxococcales bacterium]